MFSTLLDISSFFIGILINLLLIAMICFYFKKKIDNLELSQSEQAKMLYTLLSSRDGSNIAPNNEIIEENIISVSDDVKIVSTHPEENLENNNNEQEEPESEEDIDEDSDEDSAEDSDEDSGEDSGEEDIVDDEVTKIIKDVSLNEVMSLDEDSMIVKSKDNLVVDYNRMTIKELKELLENKGKTSLPSRAKKSDLIELLNDEYTTEQTEEESVKDDVENIVEKLENHDIMMETTKLLLNKNLDISNIEN